MIRYTQAMPKVMPGCGRCGESIAAWGLKRPGWSENPVNRIAFMRIHPLTQPDLPGLFAQPGRFSPRWTV